MPKKLGINTKAVEARARKDAAKQAEKERKEREAEEAYWKDDDKQVLKKMQRKDEKEKKKQEQAEKKAALRAAYEEEMNSIKAAAKTAAGKVTRAEIATMIQKQNAEKAQKRELLHDEVPLEENVNRLVIEGESARTIDEAIAVLSSGKDAEMDRHPERRVKAAYAAFEEANLPKLKAENPNLRLSQLKQMLKKDWMKSPENPLNQRHLDYNIKK